MGRDVIPCDFFAKIDFFTLFDRNGCSLHENHGVQIFQAPESNLGSNFQTLSLEPIDRQRVTQHNIDLIIFKDSTVNFRRVKGAVSTFNTFIFIKNARKPVLELFFSYQSPKSHYLPSMFNFIAQHLLVSMFL